MKSSRLLLVVVALAALVIPLVHAITFIGAINYVGANGGNVTFAQNFTAYSLTYVDGLNFFTNIVWIGRNCGNMGFDAGGGVNMSVTNITPNQVVYTVAYAVVNDTFVSRIGAGAPTSVTGGVYVYNAVDEMTTVTPAGPGMITISWAAGTHSLYTDTINYVSMASIIPLIVTFGYLIALAQGMAFDPKQAAVIIITWVVSFVIIGALLSVYT